MQLIKPIFLVVVLLSSFSLVAQESLMINFDPSYHSVEKNGHGFMKLIDNHSNKVQYDGSTYEIKFPDQFFVNDTAIAFNYFTGWKNPAIDKSTAFLFGNYSSNSPIVYVDYNHNLDFSDDGEALRFELDSTIVVYLNNSELPSAYFPIKFFYPKLGLAQKKQIESIFTSMGPDAEGNNFVGIDYWLADKRLNYKLSNIWINGKSIKIGLYDYDCNGLFNDEGKDRILIGNYEEDMISGKLDQGAVEYSKNVQISIGDIVYEVVDIEATGRYLKLVRSDKTYHKPLGVGDYIGDLEINLISGESTSIKDLLNEEKHLLLDFWGSWCRGCTQQLPELKKMASVQSDKIQIFGLNYGDTPSSMSNYLSKHEIEWKNGIASEEIMNTLRIDGFPNYLLLDPSGKILLMNGTLEEIAKRL